jgi:hypothetical protein
MSVWDQDLSHSSGRTSSSSSTTTWTIRHLQVHSARCHARCTTIDDRSTKREVAPQSSIGNPATHRQVVTQLFCDASVNPEPKSESGHGPRPRSDPDRFETRKGGQCKDEKTRKNERKESITLTRNPHTPPHSSSPHTTLSGFPQHATPRISRRP